LPNFNIKFFNWSIIVLLGFEIAYIAIQAGRGQLSHYNMSTPVYAALYSMMALAASLTTIYTAYVGYQFFTQSVPELPTYYLWAIRLSIVIFVIFSFEGFAMGSTLSHSVGALNDNSNLFIMGWSKTVGDLRLTGVASTFFLCFKEYQIDYCYCHSLWTFGALNLDSGLERKTSICREGEYGRGGVGMNELFFKRITRYRS
jgi:hypothetical protein